MHSTHFKYNLHCAHLRHTPFTTLTLASGYTYLTEKHHTQHKLYKHTPQCTHITQTNTIYPTPYPQCRHFTLSHPSNHKHTAHTPCTYFLKTHTTQPHTRWCTHLTQTHTVEHTHYTVHTPKTDTQHTLKLHTTLTDTPLTTHITVQSAHISDRHKPLMAHTFHSEETSYRNTTDHTHYTVNEPNRDTQHSLHIQSNLQTPNTGIPLTTHTAQHPQHTQKPTKHYKHNPK